MASIDLILPFALPPPELARDLLRQARLPALATLLAKGRIDWQRADPWARQLPHQRWLLQQRGLGLADNGVAAAAMNSVGIEPGQGRWFMLNPAHLHIARDHLVLTDLRRLDLEENESRTLFEAALPLFADAGRELIYGSKDLWFMRADDWSELETSTPDAAVGHNIDIWLPQGAGDRAWRKLLNEVQMTWHTLDINQQREMRGRPVINALWCWNARHAAPARSEPVDYHEALLDAFVPTGRAVERSLPKLLARGERGLVVADDMSAAALASDWGSWLAAIDATERAWFAPLHAALKDGSLAGVRLVLTDGARLAACACSAGALKKFWRKPSLDRLLDG